MEYCPVFEDYSYLESAPLPIQECPIPQEISCPYARAHEPCLHYTPITEADLRKKLHLLQNHPPRCLLLSCPDEKFQGSVPIEERHLLIWSDKYQHRVDFHLQPFQPGEKYPCGPKAACKESRSVQLRDKGAVVEEKITVTDQIFSFIRENLPGPGKPPYDPKYYEIIHAWAVRESPEKPGRAILKREIAQGLKGGKLESKIKYVSRVLDRAKEDNPKVYKILKDNRRNRASVTHGGKVDRN